MEVIIHVYFGQTSIPVASFLVVASNYGFITGPRRKEDNYNEVLVGVAD